MLQEQDCVTHHMGKVIASLKMSKMSTVASCIVKSAMTLQWTVNPSYYSLAQVGGLLFGITNPRAIFFYFAIYLKFNRRMYYMHF